MAAIGKIRSWGSVLAIVIGVALFSFIAEEAVRSCESTGNARRQQIGEVLGEKVSMQEFQTLMDEYQEFYKIYSGRDNLSEEEQNQVKDNAWNDFVNTKLIADEAERLGLTVTDTELQNILREGTNPMLLRTPFINEQTGRFDVSLLSNFLNQYQTAVNSSPEMAQQYESLYKFWNFIEKQLRQQVLTSKYVTLLSSSLISNPVSAQAEFDAQNIESLVLLASLPYDQVSDSSLQVTDSELKAKYNEVKERFYQPVETRDIAYVTLQVVPSQSDRDSLFAQLKRAQADLQGSDADVADVVRKAHSLVSYTTLPVTEQALTTMGVKAAVDSLSDGQVSNPFEGRDNTLNVVKLIKTESLPDSIEYRAIYLFGDDAALTADTVVTKLNQGTDFEVLAEQYDQSQTAEKGAKHWIRSQEYEGNGVLDAVSRDFIIALNTQGRVGEAQRYEMPQGNIVYVVTNRKQYTKKYQVAVVKRTIDFSNETYTEAYNRFSQYVSGNSTIADLREHAAEFGLRVVDREGVTNDQHFVERFRGTSNALRWIFDSRVGDVSQLYECGNNDRLLIIGLTAINPVGYRSWESVRDELRDLVLQDKKFAQQSALFAGLKSVNEAEAKGAKIDTVRQVTFAANVSVPSLHFSEPALSGAIAAVAEGQLSPAAVKGLYGTYFFQVLNKQKVEGAELIENEYEQRLQNKAAQIANYLFLNDLLEKAKVVDNRYLFF